MTAAELLMKVDARQVAALACLTADGPDFDRHAATFIECLNASKVIAEILSDEAQASA